MKFKYEYANSNKKRHSTIIKDNGTFIPLAKKPSAGFTAYTRFFGTSIDSQQPKFVVKQPKRDNPAFIKAYKNEQAVWNSVYPNQRAELVEEGGLRLILPCLPGDMFSLNKSNEPLIYCKQVLAVAYAVQEFHQLGWAHNDFNQDNILIEEKANGVFKAYLIDFDGVSRRDSYKTNSEILLLNSLIYPIPNLRCRDYYFSVDLLIEHLLIEIDKLEQRNQKNQVSRF